MLFWLFFAHRALEAADEVAPDQGEGKQKKDRIFGIFGFFVYLCTLEQRNER